MSQFGQPPLAAFLPLRAGQNLSDLPDKPAALANLGTLSTSDIMMNSVPIGTIIPFWGNTAPVGYLPCNGQTVNSGTFPDLVAFLGGGSSQALPDLRGEFLRGWDNGRGVDVGRAIKTAQADELKSHSHTLNAPTSIAASGGSTGVILSATPGSNWSTSSVGGVETRPRNIAVLYCMKAYGALVNTSTANIGNVLTELSQCTKLTQFGVAFGDDGYQKLPSGLIIQWGARADGVAEGTNLVFPIAFPNALLKVIPTARGINGGTSLLSANWDRSASNLSSVRINGRYVNNGGVVGPSTQGIEYIAIGY